MALDHAWNEPATDGAEGIVLSPAEEVELEQIIAENDEDERAGRTIPWEQFLAER